MGHYGWLLPKLRTARHLKAESNANEACVGFTGRDAMIANQHQEGGGTLPRRQILGLTSPEIDSIKGSILDALAE